MDDIVTETEIKNQAAFDFFASCVLAFAGAFIIMCMI
jgi:hypothetical protein